MKTEEFDDAFRRKLESLETPFTEGDVERVHGYVANKQTAGNRGRKIGLFSVLSLLLLLSAGLLTWNLFQLNENKLLLKENAEIKESLIKANDLLSQNLSPVHDTVYLEKYTSGPNKQSTIAKSNENSGSANSYAGKIEKGSDKALTNVGSKYSPSSTYTSAKTHKEESSKENLMTEKTLNDNYAQNNFSKGNKLKEVSKNENSGKMLNDGQKEISSRTNDSLSAPLANASDSAIKVNPEITNNTSSEKANDTSEVTVREENIPLLKRLGFNVGINLEKANSQFGFGLIGEVLVGNRWSVTAGAKFLRIYNEKYGDEDEYRQRNGKDFISTYYPNSHDSITASDIDFKYSILQIPLAINYRLPVGHHFSVLFSAGTDIDLYAKKTIKYEYRAYGERERRSSESNSPVVAFNNAVFAVGIERRFGRFPIQLSPFISPQLKYTDYKKQNLFYGIRLRILYNI